MLLFILSMTYSDLHTEPIDPTTDSRLIIVTDFLFV